MHIICLPLADFHNMLTKFWPITCENDKYEVIRRHALGMLYSANAGDLLQGLLGALPDDYHEKGRIVEEHLKQAWTTNRSDERYIMYVAVNDASYASRALQQHMGETWARSNFAFNSFLPIAVVEGSANVFSHINKELDEVYCNLEYNDSEEPATIILQTVTTMMKYTTYICNK